MNQNERADRKLALTRYNRKQETKQAAKVYEEERTLAIGTLLPAVKTFARVLRRCAEYYPDSDACAMLSAYAQAEALLLQLLREKGREAVKATENDLAE